MEYYQECSFFLAIKFICRTIGLDIYHDFDENVPDSIKITKMLIGLNNDIDDNQDMPLVPINEHILSYYNPCYNELFEKDNIPAETQMDFGIGYDDVTNRITIPIRDEYGTLVGVKGRWFGDPHLDGESKYMYIEPCAKGQILYGLDRSYNAIKLSGKVFVCESEKAVMQLFSYGYQNCVACGGKNISSAQISKLTRLCSDIIFAFDKDVEKEKLENLAAMFTSGICVYAIIDTDGVLSEKMSPTDDPVVFTTLLKNGMVRLC